VRTNVYVDGFNLYYRAVRGTAYKWLDLNRLCHILLPSHQLHRIRYFTALIDARPPNTQAPIRQQTYIRALQTVPNLTVHYGQFRTRKKRTPLVLTNQGMGAVVEVWDTEEKGSDVNLATYLLVDAFDKDYEQAVVISNDSDLALPVRMVRDQFHLPVGVVNPNCDRREAMPKELSDAATFQRQLRGKALELSQFPPTLEDAHGTITKPETW